MTLASSMVPLALLTVYPWTGLAGGVLTRTSYGFPLTSPGKVKVKGPLPTTRRGVAAAAG